MHQDISVSKISAFLSATGLTCWISLMVSLLYLSRWSNIGNAERMIAIFHRGVGKLFNLDCHIKGELCRDRPTLYVCNHISYLDIFILGAHIPGSFIAKSEVAKWPVFGSLAKLQKTLFFERNSIRAAAQVKQMQQHLIEKSNLILFPEGTSTPGTQVEPFRSSLFQAATNDQTTIKIQPITIAYTHYANEKMNQHQRDHYAWYIPMPFASHFLNGMGLRKAQVTVTFHPTVTTAEFASRKDCAKYCEDQVRKGLLNALG